MQTEYTEAKDLLHDVSPQRMESAAQNWKHGLRGVAWYSVCERPRYGVGCGSCKRCSALRIIMVKMTGKA